MSFKPVFVSEEKKANIRKAYAEGMNRSELSNRLKLHWNVINRIVADMPDPYQGHAQQLFTSLSARHPLRYKNPPRDIIEE